MYGLLAILEAKLILEDLEAKKEGYDSETEREETKNVATKEKVEKKAQRSLQLHRARRLTCSVPLG